MQIEQRLNIQLCFLFFENELHNEWWFGRAYNFPVEGFFLLRSMASFSNAISGSINFLYVYFIFKVKVIFFRINSIDSWKFNDFEWK